jgi:hypothetical protein
VAHGFLPRSAIAEQVRRFFRELSSFVPDIGSRRVRVRLVDLPVVEGDLLTTTSPLASYYEHRRHNQSQENP